MTLPRGTLDTYRRANRSNMPHLMWILPLTSAAGVGGKVLQTWADPKDAQDSVACRVSPVGSTEQERLIADGFEETPQYTVVVDAGIIVPPGARLYVEGETRGERWTLTLEIMGEPVARSYAVQGKYLCRAIPRGSPSAVTPIPTLHNGAVAFAGAGVTAFAGESYSADAGLLAAIAAWDISAAATRVSYGGKQGASTTIPSGPRTYVLDYTNARVRQTGFIRRVIIGIDAVGAGTWKVKVFRKNGAVWDFIAESEPLTPPGAGVRTFDLVTPLPCVYGDYIAVYIPSGGVTHSGATTGLARYAAGDISSSDAFAANDGAIAPSVLVLGTAPFMVSAGDSIAAGHPNFLAVEEGGGISGDVTYEPMYNVQLLEPLVSYQNQAIGGQTWAAMVSTEQPRINTIDPDIVWYHCGVNDVGNDRNWATVQADLDALRALVPVDTKLMLTEILPWSLATDPKAAAIRTFNANYSVWCAANDATLVACHDFFGQLRVSTGELDDLKTAYALDDIHLNLAGVQALAAILKAAVDEIYTP